MTNPDFIGSWTFPTLDLTDNGIFYVYIHDRKPRKDDTVSIDGVITDFYGEATFRGELSPTHIEFIKEYLPSAIQKGAAGCPVKYKGKKHGTIYLGEYTVFNGTWGGQPVNQWKHKFVLRKYRDPSTN